MTSDGIQKLSFDEVHAIAETELKKWNLWAKGWRHVFDNSKVHIGLCCQLKKQIISSKYFILHGLNVENIIDTIRHEIAHALDSSDRRNVAGGRMIHDKVWRKYAKMVGATPRAKIDADGFRPPIEVGKYKWVMVCIPAPKPGITGGMRITTGPVEVKYVTHTRYFLSDMSMRYCTEDKDTQGQLWLVDINQWQEYENGTLPLSELVFWQDKPKDSVWGDGIPMKIKMP